MSILEWALGRKAAEQQQMRRLGLGRYFDLLVEKARQQPCVDPALLDRIERVIAHAEASR